MIPASYLDLLTGPVVVALVTVMPDGQPQATPIWCDMEGDFIRINTTKGRQKDRNMARDAKVTVLAIDPTNPYRWLEVRGVIDHSDESNGVDVINALSALYRNDPDYYGRNSAQRDKETRITYYIKPTKVNAAG